MAEEGLREHKIAEWLKNSFLFDTDAVGAMVDSLLEACKGTKEIEAKDVSEKSSRYTRKVVSVSFVCFAGVLAV